MALKDGPGKCAGRLEILYEGTQKQVFRTGWENENKKNNLQSVCTQLNCGNDGTDGSFSKGSAAFLNKAINCPSESSKISECFTEDSRRGQESVGIICKGKCLFVCTLCPLTFSYCVLMSLSIHDVLYTREVCKGADVN